MYFDQAVYHGKLVLIISFFYLLLKVIYVYEGLIFKKMIQDIFIYQSSINIV